MKQQGDPLINQRTKIFHKEVLILNLTFVECMPGYRGVNCSKMCPPGYFGRLCKLQCHCSSDMYCEPTSGCLCNTTSVNCTDPGQSNYLQLKYISRHLMGDIKKSPC